MDMGRGEGLAGRKERRELTWTCQDRYTFSSLNRCSGALRKITLQETKAQTFSELLETVVRWV